MTETKADGRGIKDRAQNGIDLLMLRDVWERLSQEWTPDDIDRIHAFKVALAHDYELCEKALRTIEPGTYEYGIHFGGSPRMLRYLPGEDNDTYWNSPSLDRIMQIAAAQQREAEQREAQQRKK